MVGGWPEEAVHVSVVDRMWSGGAKEHYANEFSGRKGSCPEQKSSNPHQSKIKGFNNLWDFIQLTLLWPVDMPCAVRRSGLCHRGGGVVECQWHHCVPFVLCCTGDIICGLPVGFWHWLRTSAEAVSTLHECFHNSWAINLWSFRKLSS